MSVPFISQNIISDHNINYQSAIFYQLSFYQWSQFSKKYQFSLLSVISTLWKRISYQLSVVPNFQILSVAYISALIKKRPTDKKTYVCVCERGGGGGGGGGWGWGVENYRETSKVNFILIELCL